MLHMRTQLLLVCALALTASLSAQTQSNLNELLQRLEQNHMGAVDAVFTKAEQEQLNLYFAPFRVEEPIQQLGGGQEIFAPENNETGDFGHFNTGSPENFNALGASGTADFEGAGVFNPEDGFAYTIDDAGNAYQIDVLTGVYTFLGTVDPPAGESITGIEFDPVSNVFFVISTDGAGNTSLSTVDWDTLELDLVGNTNITLAIALGFDLTGILYAYDIDVDMLYSIDKNTAAATMIGPIGFDASFAQGMFLSAATGNLYMTAFNNGTFRSELRMVDTATGNTTLVGLPGSVTPGGVTQFGWASAWDNTLSVNDLATGDFTFFPNPARNALQLRAELPISRIQIYNLQGRLLIDQALGQPQGQIDISGLSSGSYILNVQLGDQTDSHLFVKE